MSYAIIRIQKFHAQAVRGIQIHDHREKDVSHSNPDIDRERSSLNYALEEASSAYVEAVQKRIAALDLKKAIRKDAVVMCQALITSDKAFFGNLTPEKERQFFSGALDFIKNRYGPSNIISAVVHKDEKTPHLHINFTPIKGGRLSAKAIFTKTELTELQTAFAQEVGATYGLPRGESREIKRKHLSTERFKLETCTVSRDSVTVHDVVPRTLKKGFLSSIVEDSIDVANRINREIVEPLAVELRQLQLERCGFLNSLKHYKYIEKDFKNLVAGLSPENLEKLKQISNDLKQKQFDEAERQRRTTQTRRLAR